MPSITLNFDAAQAERIQAALASTPYPQTVAGFKALLTDYIRSWMQEQERGKAQRDALATVAAPADLTVT